MELHSGHNRLPASRSGTGLALPGVPGTWGHSASVGVLCLRFATARPLTPSALPPRTSPTSSTCIRTSPRALLRAGISNLRYAPVSAIRPPQPAGAPQPASCRNTTHKLQRSPYKHPTYSLGNTSEYKRCNSAATPGTGMVPPIIPPHTKQPLTLYGSAANSNKPATNQL